MAQKLCICHKTLAKKLQIFTKVTSCEKKGTLKAKSFEKPFINPILRITMNKKLLLLLTTCLTLTPALKARSEDGWKVAVGAGAIAGGVALLWHGISEYNARTSLSDDKNSVIQVEELTNLCNVRYNTLSNLTEQHSSKPSIASYIHVTWGSFNACNLEFQRDFSNLNDALAHLKTNLEYWQDLDSRESLANRGERIRPSAQQLLRQLQTLCTFLKREEAYFSLYEVVNQQTEYLNPQDPFQHLSAAQLIDSDCRELQRALLRLERSNRPDYDDSALLKSAHLLLNGLNDQRNRLMQSNEYHAELQLKLRDDREKERIAIQNRLARAEEEKAHAERDKVNAMHERNRIEQESAWREEQEMKKIRNRLERIENRLHELKNKTEHPPYQPESPEFYLWIRGELSGFDQF
ncbi:MAG: hypothetical protein UW09_C0004G0035 [candidate division TM6 bacterium GW2011_GWF2_43_87]|nr:MAG: hypothetical protein UW09_C0004G0035 [candidate division TM6 bacterium GW2011_GWF2_43_87]